jgi:carnitine-CoA ligase
MGLARFFDGIAGEHPNRAAAYLDGRPTSYAAIRQRAWAIGAALQELERPGERIATLVPNEPELYALIIAVAHAGAINVPMLTDGTTDDIAYMLADCDASVLITTKDRWRGIEAAAPRTLRRVVLVDWHETAAQTAGGRSIHGLAELERRGATLGIDPAPMAERDAMLIAYTSGSTARAKGVIIDGASFIKDAAYQPELLELDDGDTVLGVVPLFHIAGWHQSLAIAMGARGALMMQRRFSASRFWPDVDAAQTRAGLLMPAMLAILLAQPLRDDDVAHPLRAVMSHWIDEEFEHRFGAETICVYGQTEAGGLAVSTQLREPRASGYVGRPAPGTEVEIRDEEFRTLHAGSTGQICIRSPWLMKGYWGQPEQTAETLRGGWLHTGDLGFLEPDGRLFYAGRSKNMIKRAGENVSAAEVEAALREHPDILEAACFSVPDPIRTEEIKVVLILAPGTPFDPAALAEWSAARLAAFKVPRYWEARDSLPRLQTGTSLGTRAGIGRRLRDQAHAAGPGDGRTIAMWPPSIKMSEPLTNAAAGESRNAMTLAASSAVPIRPMAVVLAANRSCSSTDAAPSAACSAKESISIGVSMLPGMTQFTRIPREPTRRANARAKRALPAFAAEYGIDASLGRRLATLPITTIDPPAFIRATAA